MKHFNGCLIFVPKSSLSLLVRPPVQMTNSQLANAAAKYINSSRQPFTFLCRIFESYSVDERDTVDLFASTACYSMTDLSNPLKKPRKTESSAHSTHPAVVGEQVGENLDWLTSCHRSLLKSPDQMKMDLGS
jgi:hypothetical protein